MPPSLPSAGVDGSPAPRRPVPLGPPPRCAGRARCASATSRPQRAAPRRLARPAGLDPAGSDEEDPAHESEGRQQDRPRPEHVAEKARHARAHLLGHGTAHEVGGVADISVGSHEHRTGRDRREGRRELAREGRRIAAREIEEDEVGRGVVEEAREPPVIQKYMRSIGRPVGSLTSSNTGRGRPPAPPSRSPVPASWSRRCRRTAWRLRGWAPSRTRWRLGRPGR